MDINDYRTKYTKQEFIREIKLGSSGKIQTRDNCPSSWNLTEHKCNDYTNCNDCWYDAVKYIQFKGEEDEIIEELKNNSQWTFNLEEFQDESIAILCPTSTEFDILLKTLVTNGMELDKSHYQYSYSDENKDICYDLDCGILEYCDEEWYYDHDYKIYKFSDVDFSQVYTKESIDDASLHNRKQVDEFDITKVKYITREQLNTTRPLRNGDIVGDKCNYGIVYGNSVIYMTANCTETINLKAYCEFIPVELIESNRDIQNAISKFMSSNLKDYYVIKDYFIPIQEEPKPKTICKVEFVVDADNLREFILENEEAIEGEIVEVKTGGTYQYARVKEIEIRELTECEVVLFKTCRKLS